MTSKEVNVTLTKANVLEFNSVFAQVKVKGLPQQSYIDFLTLKVKMSNLVEQIDRERVEGIRMVLKELGYGEGDNIPEENQNEVNVKLNGVIGSLFTEVVELNTKVLSEDDFYSSILSIDENNDLATEQKAALMKYLVK